MGAQQTKEPRSSSSGKSKVPKTKEPRISSGNIFAEHNGLLGEEALMELEEYQ